MYKSLIGENVAVIISTRSDNMLEYTGTLSSESDETIALSNANILYLMTNFTRGAGLLGENMNKIKGDLEKVVINKEYIISCNKQ